MKPSKPPFYRDPEVLLSGIVALLIASEVFLFVGAFCGPEQPWQPKRTAPRVEATPPKTF
jgi:hypothetical protein